MAAALPGRDVMGVKVYTSYGNENHFYIMLFSTKKGEPEWLLDWRLSAYRHWSTLEEPAWQNVVYEPTAAVPASSA